MKLFAFDFDKTITKSDTILPICRFIAEHNNSIFAFRIIQINFILLRLKIIDSKKFKEKIVLHLLKGKSKDEIEIIISNFLTKHFNELLNQKITDIISEEKKSGNKIIIVTSNLELFVNPVKKLLSADEVFGTKIKINDGIIVAGIERENCSGIRKAEIVNNYKSKFHFEKIIAYGDSIGDYKMLEFSDESYLANYRYSSLLNKLRCRLNYFNGKVFTKGIEVTFMKVKSLKVTD